MQTINLVLDRIEDYISVACFTLMSIIVLVAIFLRYVLFYPFPWGEEAARYLMSWGIFFGISIGVRKKAHLGVEAFVDKLPRSVAKWVEAASELIILAAFAVFAYLSLDLMLTIRSNGQVSPAMQMPMWFAYAAMPIGFTLCIIRQLQVFYNDFISRERDTSRYEEVQIS